jgi:hypothetical protein
MTIFEDSVLKRGTQNESETIHRRKRCRRVGCRSRWRLYGCQCGLSSSPGMMKLGCQTAPTNDVHLRHLARYGVQNICGYPEIEGNRLYASVDELKRMIDMAASASTASRRHSCRPASSTRKSIRRSCWLRVRSATVTSSRCRRLLRTARWPEKASAYGGFSNNVSLRYSR